MNSYQLDCFLRVATYLNFARAAEELHVSQPAVTHQIKALENELGVKLFNRTTRNVSLTHEGEIFLPEAGTFVILLRSLQEKFRIPEKREIIPFRIAVTSEATMELLPDVLYKLSYYEPKIYPILKNVPVPQIVKKLDEGYTDIALGPQEVLPKESDIVYTEVVKSSIMCVFDDTYPVCTSKSLTFEQLKNYNLIFYRPTACGSEIAVLQAELSKGKPTDEIFFCDDIVSAFTLAKSGYGVSLIPEIFLPRDRNGIIASELAGAEKISFGVYRKKDGIPLALEFISFIKEAIRTKSGD